MELRVECYAGYKGEERPIRFLLGSRQLEVESIDDQWYEPSADYFRLLASDGNTYILRHDRPQDLWTLQVYQSGSRLE